LQIKREDEILQITGQGTGSGSASTYGFGFAKNARPVPNGGGRQSQTERKIWNQSIIIKILKHHKYKHKYKHK
jgi:hypothetical protein